MTLEIWLIYVTTVLLLMCTPGPSQLLMLSNSASHGVGRALSTAAGDLSANALQMLAAGLGLATILTASALALGVVKWAGVIYLIWLGLRMIRKAGVKAAACADSPHTASLRQLWIQGFVTSAANPKAVVFFAALFPQFIQAESAFWPQFAILSVTYLIMDGLFLTAYGLGAGWIARRLKGPAKAWIDRIGGGFMILAALLLGLKSIARTTA